MTSSSSITSKMILKLLVDTKTERVLFAEASKDFVDFLFNLHRLPIGTITYLLTKTNMVGSLGKLYESIENLSNTYLLQQNQDKDILLKPKNLIPPGFLLLPDYEGDIEEEEEEEEEEEGEEEEEEEEEEEDREGDPPMYRIKRLYNVTLVKNNLCSNCNPKLYMCRNRCPYNVTLVKNTRCSNCYGTMNYSVTYVGKKEMEVEGCGRKDGFVKEAVMYMVMDDLVVQPMSPISCITLLSKFNIKDASSLQEMVVEFGIQEGIQLLKASLQCNNALTSVFLKDIKFKKGSNMILH
ncbi:uncharacterized protein LOC129292087 [Prosopis cineraria]|uniref:uncharacterized protein LOC129292087 n=1 Tax=Prosopis cineraria TaxID=364024 RepID=UPI00240EB40F|nr:uncharacterized protein LOC129292087 [Prosopis cineraria]